ncbi:hypothetical protein [Shimia sp. MMG029]|uniref:hypothetical protein n=1 Tax=Shimia sp. MMG029 TaxID=3021978 RepID=UPI0022FEA442|nr:hypothetical protein [Shimia sp. MMG029]MDA5555133.1 hypothetical protein [Shimia sp. MMG029]
MPDLTIPSIPESVLESLTELAGEAGCSLEEYAARLVKDAVADFWCEQGTDISFTQLQANMEAIFRIADRNAVFLMDAKGQRFVLLSVSEFEQISGNATGSI